MQLAFNFNNSILNASTAPAPVARCYAQQSKVIMNQLGGARKLAMFPGLKSVTYHSDFCGVTMILPLAKHAGAVNKVVIKLNGLDLYDMTFIRKRGKNEKVISELNDVYAEDLINCFESATGLYIRF